MKAVATKIVTMFLCESRRLCLKPDMLYRFEVDEGCEKCRDCAEEARVSPPDSAVDTGADDE